ncbi:MAG TPA: bifunctional homocysteine S-methyltransferase/methylenetetrahydrofolate reductase [Anaerolineaceae bacterium]|nr:bifunctional homocysteine S-methyltransferase/methylenetetrahydrofolate reductase [Anaerolineaceae bacterium]
MSSENKFRKQLSESKPILSDGAMGTVLHQKGIRFDECFDHLNITNPAMVADVHRSYIEAGSTMIQTNTFGANRYKLSEFGLEDKLVEINQAGVDLVRRVSLASFKDVIIAGDIGPLGVRLAPFGRVQLEEAREAFSEQIKILLEAGVDVIIIETMTDFYEVREAIQATRELDPKIPIVASMTFTRDDRTLLGDTPEKVATNIFNTGADVIGINCSGGPLQLLRILKKMKVAVPQAVFSVMPNAGWPEQQDGRIMYPAGSEYFGEYAISFWQAGAKVLGGCCGTTPQHIQAIARVIQNTKPEDIAFGLEIPEIQIETETESSAPKSELAQKMESNKFIFAVEMDPPRGLSTKKLLAGASLLADSGADVINVADSPMARMRMSPWAVCSLIQRYVGVETVLHFPTRGRNLLRVQGDLLAAHALGIRNVFVVMGDPTAIGDYPDAMDNYDLVPSGLIKLIKQSFNIGIDHAGTEIGQPTSFFVGSALNLNSSNMEAELKNHIRKNKAGSDFVLTQPIFDAKKALENLKWYREHAPNENFRIMVGILPLVTDRHAAFLHHEVPGIIIPDEIINRMRKAGDKSATEGIKIAVELIEELRSEVQGVYLMPAFNRFDYVSEIIEKVKKSN